MKVAVNLIERKIADKLPDEADENTPFLVNNNYVLIEVDNCYLADNKTFRDLTDDELLPIETVEWKANRELLVSQIEVEYQGRIYQGDETSQDRMSRALAVLPDGVNATWRTSDNQNVSITKDDLKEILFLAGQEQTRIWFENEPITQGETL